MQQRIIGISLIVVLWAMPLLETAQAQQPRQGQRGQTARQDTMPMMPRMMTMMGGMHQQIMQHPMHRAAAMVYALPALADTLGFSDEQRQQLQQLQQQLTEQQQEHRQAMRTQREQLMNLFDGEAQPEPDAVRERFQAMADLRAEQQADRYETAVQMRNVLTDEQQNALDQMEPRAMHRHLMANMTVMEMMQMMRAVRGGMMGPDGPGMMRRMPMRPGSMGPHHRPRNRR